jgi:hypothetical protein
MIDSYYFIFSEPYRPSLMLNPEKHYSFFHCPEGDYLDIEYQESEIILMAQAVNNFEPITINLTLVPFLADSEQFYMGWHIGNDDSSFFMSGIDKKESWDKDYYNDIYQLDRLKHDFDYYHLARQRMLISLSRQLIDMGAENKVKAWKLKKKIEQELEDINQYQYTNTISAFVKI